MNRIQRRQAILAIAATSIAAGGCERQKIDQTIAETSTETLENTRVGLRGFQIIAFTVGRRIVYLPHPAVRILGVALVTSGVVTFLLIEYLDVELKRRSMREALAQREIALIESQVAVNFTTENGLTESVALGPNQYEPTNSVAP